MLKHAPLQEILERSKKAGISKMLSVSVDEVSWQANQDLAKNNENVYYSLGIHPHEAIHWNGLKDKFVSYYESSPVKKKCLAVGEIGLDYFYNHSPRETQITAFLDQLEIAKKLDLPIIIHCRDSFDELYGLLRTHGMPSKGGVMHCFTGNSGQAKEALDLGFYISFSGIVTFKKATDLQAAAKIVPEDRIVVETDCPFLAPVPHRGAPNEPAFIVETVKFLSGLRNVPLDSLATSLEGNSSRLFRF